MAWETGQFVLEGGKGPADTQTAEPGSACSYSAAIASYGPTGVGQSRRVSTSRTNGPPDARASGRAGARASGDSTRRPPAPSTRPNAAQSTVGRRVISAAPRFIFLARK